MTPCPPPRTPTPPATAPPPPPTEEQLARLVAVHILSGDAPDASVEAYDPLDPSLAALSAALASLRSHGAAQDVRWLRVLNLARTMIADVARAEAARSARAGHWQDDDEIEAKLDLTGVEEQEDTSFGAGPASPRGSSPLVPAQKPALNGGLPPPPAVRTSRTAPYRTAGQDIDQPHGYTPFEPGLRPRRCRSEPGRCPEDEEGTRGEEGAAVGLDTNNTNRGTGDDEKERELVEEEQTVVEEAAQGCASHPHRKEHAGSSPARGVAHPSPRNASCASTASLACAALAMAVLAMVVLVAGARSAWPQSMAASAGLPRWTAGLHLPSDSGAADRRDPNEPERHRHHGLQHGVLGAAACSEDSLAAVRDSALTAALSLLSVTAQGPGAGDLDGLRSDSSGHARAGAPGLHAGALRVLRQHVGPDTGLLKWVVNASWVPQWLGVRGETSGGRRQMLAQRQWLPRALRPTTTVHDAVANELAAAIADAGGLG